MTIRWGILGPGAIAGAFADDLRFVPDAQVVAVGSRDRERAIAFASRRAIPYAHGSYEALANDPNVDVIYIATPHSRHHEDALLCLRAGKHVLVEKPFTVTKAQAEEIAAVAASVGRFAMEATWTRFFPLFAKVRELIISGRIGSVVEMRASLGHTVRFDPSARLWDPERAGGALMDVGPYPLTWAVGMLGFPVRVEADASFAANGIDEATGIRLTHENGAVSLLSASQRSALPNHVTIDGTEGRISVHLPIYAPRRVTAHSRGTDAASSWTQPLADLDQIGSPMFTSTDRLPSKVLRVWGSGPARKVRNKVAEQLARTDDPLVDTEPGQGYHYEAAAVGRCLAAGQAQSDIWPLSGSIEMMGLLDDIRAQIGLRFPFE